jgi:hypothetical protein
LFRLITASGDERDSDFVEEVTVKERRRRPPWSG